MKKTDNMRYAVNLGDLMGYKDPMCPVQLLLGPVLTKEAIEVASDKVDGVALLLDDSDPERLDAILRLLRMKCKPYQLRLYQSKTGKGGWKTARIAKVVT